MPNSTSHIDYCRCPRNNKHKVVEKANTVICSICGTFEKTEMDLVYAGELDADEILTVEEKNAFLDIMGMDGEKDGNIFFSK